MSTQLNEFERFVPTHIEDLESLRLIDTTNKVMVQIHTEDVEKTIGGLTTVGVKKFAFAKNTSRRATVVKVCDRIACAHNSYEFTLWQTKVQVRPGDEVFINYYDNISNYDFYYKGVLMKIIPYSAIICVKRRNWITMCNGYVLLEDVIKETSIAGVVWKNVIPEEGIVRYIGEPNERYYMPVIQRDYAGMIRTRKIWSGIYGKSDTHYMCKSRKKSDPKKGTIKKGDKVRLDDTKITFYLEEYAYARLNKRKMYRVTQQHNIAAILA